LLSSLREEDRAKLQALGKELRSQVGQRVVGGCKVYGMHPDGPCPSRKGWIKLNGKKYPACYNLYGGCIFLKRLPLRVLAGRIAEAIVKGG